MYGVSEMEKMREGKEVEVHGTKYLHIYMYWR